MTMDSDPAADPVLVEATRGSMVESLHRGAVAVCDARGTLILAAGGIARPIYPRSAYKFLQALPLVESGAADAFHLGNAELALACASHGSEPAHVARVAGWLERIGCTADDLVCGPHVPSHGPSAEAMTRSGAVPTRLHNNCSGKHTGFLTLARHLGVPVAGYGDPDHAVQRAVRAVLCEMAEVSEPLTQGGDGCAAPNFALPVHALARAFARIADPAGLAPARRAAIERLRGALAAEPFFTAGTDRLDTDLIAATKGAVLIKVGAEGVYAACVPSRGLGLALKIEDGGRRAAEIAIVALLVKLGVIEPAHAARWTPQAVRDWNGRAVGEIRAAGPLV